MQWPLLCVSLALSSIAFCEEPGPGPETPEVILAFPAAVMPTAEPMDLSYQPLDPVSKRLFGIIPNYRADQYQTQYTPISTAGKFAIARSDSFDWPNYFLLAGYAIQSQVAEGGFKHSGGLSAFGRFYSRSVADQIIGAYVTEAMLPTLFHEDPRFFRLGKGSVWYRAYNAAAHIVITKKDDGSDGFYYSEIVGNLGVTAIGMTYYPDNRSAGEAIERYSMALGNDVISNLLTEFWPDIKRRLPLLHRHP